MVAVLSHVLIRMVPLDSSPDIPIHALPNLPELLVDVLAVRPDSPSGPEAFYRLVVSGIHLCVTGGLFFKE